MHPADVLAAGALPPTGDLGPSVKWPTAASASAAAHASASAGAGPPGRGTFVPRHLSRSPEYRAAARAAAAAAAAVSAAIAALAVARSRVHSATPLGRWICAGKHMVGPSQPYIATNTVALAIESTEWAYRCFVKARGALAAAREVAVEATEAAARAEAAARLTGVAMPGAAAEAAAPPTAEAAVAAGAGADVADAVAAAEAVPAMDGADDAPAPAPASADELAAVAADLRQALPEPTAAVARSDGPISVGNRLVRRALRVQVVRRDARGNLPREFAIGAAPGDAAASAGGAQAAQQAAESSGGGAAGDDADSPFIVVRAARRCRARYAGPEPAPAAIRWQFMSCSGDEWRSAARVTL